MSWKLTLIIFYYLPTPLKGTFFINIVLIKLGNHCIETSVSVSNRRCQHILGIFQIAVYPSFQSSAKGFKVKKFAKFKSSPTKILKV